jgi:hypothetical protein
MNHLLQVLHGPPMSRLGQHDYAAPQFIALIVRVVVGFRCLEIIHEFCIRREHLVVKIFVNDDAMTTRSSSGLVAFEAGR